MVKLGINLILVLIPKRERIFQTRVTKKAPKAAKVCLNPLSGKESFRQLWYANLWKEKC